MAKLGYCKIDNVRLDSESLKAVNEIKDIMKSGDMLSTAVAAIPLVQLFASPGVTKSAAELGISITEYDWEEFGNALQSTSLITRNQIYKVAEMRTFYTNGAEKNFWRCVSEAAL